MILYRYLKAEDAISTLERGFLKTSRCSDFNDPFELAWRPALTATEAVNEFIKTRPVVKYKLDTSTRLFFQ